MEQVREQLWHQWKRKNDPQAKNKLIESYLPLVRYVVNRFSNRYPRNVHRDDLISYGTFGLIDAVEKFDLERGLRFETYASWRIRGAMIDGLRQNDWVPRTIREKAKNIEVAYEELEQKYMRTVTDEEVSEHLQVSVEQFQKMLQEISLTALTSLEEPIKEEEMETRKMLLMDEQAKNPDHKVNEVYQKETLAQAIERLTEREKVVVSLFYYEELTLSEIAEVMSLTPSRISQLHSRAMLRLRDALACRKHELLDDD